MALRIGWVWVYEIKVCVGVGGNVFEVCGWINLHTFMNISTLKLPHLFKFPGFPVSIILVLESLILYVCLLISNHSNIVIQ